MSGGVNLLVNRQKAWAHMIIVKKKTKNIIITIFKF